jgi:hypothetical protein
MKSMSDKHELKRHKTNQSHVTIIFLFESLNTRFPYSCTHDFYASHYTYHIFLGVRRNKHRKQLKRKYLISKISLMNYLKFLLKIR